MNIQRRRPLVSYDTNHRASLISSNNNNLLMPIKSKRKRTIGKRKKRKSNQSIKIVKGRVNVKLAGSKTLKLAPAKLLPFVSKQQIKQAAKHLVQNRHKPKRRSIKRKK